MEKNSLKFILVITFLLTPLPAVDLIGSSSTGEDLGREEKTRGVIRYSSKSIENQTTDGITRMNSSKSISKNWNSLSPTRAIVPATASSSTSRGIFYSGQYHETFQSPSSLPFLARQEKRYYNFPLSSSSSASFFAQSIGSSLGTVSEHRTHVAPPQTLTPTSAIASGTNQVGLSAVEIPMPMASSSRISGPYFETNISTIHVSAKAGQKVVLDCAVILLQGRTVSWLKKTKSSLTLLTVSNETYYSDSRLGLRFRYPNNWRLVIESVKKEDDGEYQCQVSSHPIKALIYHLKVIAPAVIILDENDHAVTERHYKVDSSFHLTCRASHVDKFVEKVQWFKGDRALPGGDSRIKVKLSKNEEESTSQVRLSILSLRRADAGIYSCRFSSQAISTVTVHVLNGELPAAVQHENCAHKQATSSNFQLIILISIEVVIINIQMSGVSPFTSKVACMFP